MKNIPHSKIFDQLREKCIVIRLLYFTSCFEKSVLIASKFEDNDLYSPGSASCCIFIIICNILVCILNKSSGSKIFKRAQLNGENHRT